MSELLLRVDASLPRRIRHAFVRALAGQPVDMEGAADLLAELENSYISALARRRMMADGRERSAVMSAVIETKGLPDEQIAID